MKIEICAKKGHAPEKKQKGKRVNKKGHAPVDW
jgi:hypothetical protein